MTKIKLTLLLAGGHRQTLFIEQDSLLLKQLAFALVARSESVSKLGSGRDRSPELLQVPLDEGRASLCFASSELVGLISDPPVMFQRSQPDTAQPSAGTQRPPKFQAPPQTESADHGTAIKTAPKDATILAALQQPLQPTAEVAPGVLPSKYFLAENFLSQQEHQQLMDYVLAQESQFVAASTTTGDDDYRQSLVLHHFPPFAETFRRKIRHHLPDLLPALDLEPFEASEIEAQLTAHNDGNYFRLHNDSGSPETATRVLTYVYYFYRQPKPFSGGELKIYDSKVENGFYVAADSARLIEPQNNSMIFFLSRYMHEVLPVSCPTHAFADSRFTVNGWVRR